MYSVLLLAAFTAAPESPDALFARRAAAGCAGQQAATRSAGCQGTQSFAVVPVQTVQVHAQAAGCSGGTARGHLFHRSERVAARRSGVGTFAVAAPVQTTFAVAPPQQVVPQAPAPTAPPPKVSQVAPANPQAFVIAPPAVVQSAPPVVIRQRTVTRQPTFSVPFGFHICPNGKLCPNR